MNFDLIYFVCILIGIIYGAYRGIKKESVNVLVFLGLVIASIFLYEGFFIDLFDKFNLSFIYEPGKKIFEFFGMSQRYLEVLVFIIIPILILTFILDKVLYLVFFNKADKKYKKMSKLERLLGSVLGILGGLVLGTFLLIVFNGLIDISRSGVVTNTVYNLLPQLQALLNDSARIVEVA